MGDLMTRADKPNGGRAKIQVAWTDDEVIFLIDEKAREIERTKEDAVRGRQESIQNRWTAISQGLTDVDVHRHWKACKLKWENAIREFRVISDHQKKMHVPSYWELDPVGRKAFGLPPDYSRYVFDHVNENHQETMALYAWGQSAGESRTLPKPEDLIGVGGAISHPSLSPSPNPNPSPNPSSNPNPNFIPNPNPSPTPLSNPLLSPNPNRSLSTLTGLAGEVAKRRKISGTMELSMDDALKDIMAALSKTYAKSQDGIRERHELNWKTLLEESNARARELNETLLRAAQVQADGLRAVAQAFNEKQRAPAN
eukprot:TRINITY_DN23360_c0_g1_i1.p1 TRINITY_DN23360_c0_g1~~TRINITY_DN23360_c0_g1_i1.p1  ORF type:complete len:312 (+),score=34.86 TRINITY_DN23360_c0_g1_i1:452-1387(+)